MNIKLTQEKLNKLNQLNFNNETDNALFTQAKTIISGLITSRILRQQIIDTCLDLNDTIIYNNQMEDELEKLANSIDDFIVS